MYLQQLKKKLYLQQLKNKLNVQLYTPLKYFDGLTSKKNIKTRFLRILEGSRSNTNNAHAYRPFETDTVPHKIKPSKYTKDFYKLYPKSATSLRDKSKVTGIPYDILKMVYDKGMAAWRTGHRPGASQQSWGYARVHSFITLGKTAFTADAKLFVDALSTANLSKWKLFC
jgi:hypothetical protein